MDAASRRVLRRFVASLPTAPCPKTLFHGTRIALNGTAPRGPAWFSPNEQLAESYAIEYGAGTVYTFEAKGAKLLRIRNDDEAKAVLDAIGWKIHPRLKPFSYFISGPFSGDLSKLVCQLPYDGWLVERPGSKIEVMLCEPAKFVKLVSQRDAEDA